MKAREWRINREIGCGHSGALTDAFQAQMISTEALKTTQDDCLIRGQMSAMVSQAASISRFRRLFRADPVYWV